MLTTHWIRVTVLTTAVLFSFAVERANAGVVSYWAFDENSGSTAIDAGTGGNNGTIVNATYVAGKVGTSALSFNDSNTRVDIGTPSNLSFDYTQPMSISAWIKGPPGQGSVLGKILSSAPYRGYELNVSHSTNGFGMNRANLWMINTWTTPALQFDSSVIVLDNTWHHLVVTSDGTGTGAGVRFYIDGVLDTLATASKNDLGTNTILGAGKVTIGARNGINDGQVFGGIIDEVAIYNVVLTAQQAQLLATELDTPLTLFIVPAPEPSSLMVWATAGLCTLLYRRRNRGQKKFAV